jgi:hypothetical protein
MSKTPEYLRNANYTSHAVELGGGQAYHVQIDTRVLEMDRPLVESQMCRFLFGSKRPGWIQVTWVTNHNFVITYGDTDNV